MKNTQLSSLSIVQPLKQVRLNIRFVRLITRFIASATSAQVLLMSTHTAKTTSYLLRVTYMPHLFVSVMLMGWWSRNFFALQQAGDLPMSRDKFLLEVSETLVYLILPF